MVFPFYRGENLKLKKRTPQAQAQLVSSTILGTIHCHLSVMSFWWHLFDFFTDIKFFLRVIVTQPSPRDLPDPGIKLRSPALQADSLLSQPDWQKLGIKLIMLPQSSMSSLLLLKEYKIFRGHGCVQKGLGRTLRRPSKIRHRIRHIWRQN